MTYTVTIKRTITTEISVEADSAADAKRIVESYGADVAINDFALVQENVHNCRVTNIRAN